MVSAQLGVLGAALAGLTAFVHVDKSVTVQIDGSGRPVRTFASTVSGVLARAHISVGPHDRVVPGASAHVDNHDTIVIERGRPIALTVGEQTRTVWVTARTVHDALDQLHLDQPGEWVSALGSRPIGLAGMVLGVRLPQRVHLVVDGHGVDATTTRARVADMLADYHVRLGVQDRLSVPATAYPADGMVVAVTRIDARRHVATTAIPRRVRRVADKSLLTGTTRTVAAGRDGVVQRTYALTYTNGTLTGRRLVATQVLTPMQPEVVAYGTRPRPVLRQVAVAYPAGGSGDLNWGALASCESGGNPRSVSAGGTYRGLYQFSIGTWQGVGGSGDPINASAAEQTHRAQLLYARSGRAAWPACGRYL